MFGSRFCRAILCLVCDFSAITMWLNSCGLGHLSCSRLLEIGSVLRLCSLIGVVLISGYEAIFSFR